METLGVMICIALSVFFSRYRAVHLCMQLAMHADHYVRASTKRMLEYM
jgi:hypothetical protein